MKNLIVALFVMMMTFANTAFAGAVEYVAPAAPEMMMEEPEGSMGSSGMWIIPAVLIVACIVLCFPDDEDEDEGGQISVSDIRLKTDIQQVGVADNGLPLYHFRYIGFPQEYVGVMAQDVLTHTPAAVVDGPFGYYAVDYGMLGVTMQKVD